MNRENIPETIPKLLEDTLEEQQETVITSELEGKAKVRLEIIQSLLQPCDRVAYGEIESRSEKA